MLSGDRLALSRAITVIESTHPRHIRHAQQLLAALAVERQHREAQQKAAAAAGSPAADAPAATAEPLSKEAREEAALRAPRSLRIGISGPPGVGKSTFIEALGRFLLSQGHRLAVLSIDPSSHVSGGSILGDKTRMAELARHPQAYVRPSPSKCVLGGVAAATYDTLLLCEHAGFSLVIVETVGVGQSEVSVHAMVDLMVLLAQPGGGDELQGMKKGLVELIDLVVVNKADGDMLAAARHTKLDYVHALQLNTRRKKDTDWKPQVKLCSSINQIQGQSVHPSPHDQTAEEAAELASQASAAGASGSSSAAAGPAASASRQQSQLRDIWSTMCAFDEWARGPFGDLHLRRAQQADTLLRQALSDNVAARIQHSLGALDSFRSVQQQLHTQAQQQQHPHAAAAPSAAATLPAAEVIPRVAAQRIVDEWIRREAEQQQQRSTSTDDATQRRS